LGRRARGGRPQRAIDTRFWLVGVRVEIMGAGKSETRGEISVSSGYDRSRDRRPPPQGELLLARMRSTGVARGLRVYHWLLQAYARQAPAEAAAAAARGGGGEEAALACVAPAAPRRSQRVR
jgi:hypothetical protein